ncbi:hypothetical protein BCR33DRAFT_169242 [Rhizoclosmatium globosum]|uniref:Uncharacterized protein n=1 Tax=Rhizoclosmatium globosum TaxID=329046 RepID=A0A1Y2CFB6_9FUNG|nr:hypothetical protein BCR33DRAFT_169242 [Rhizoclosmatium globosum]|eukprot:ORY45494.1 hypothetical protein BCR33DRAFT_169242 [Rhizoclosmatium globosum]
MLMVRLDFLLVPNCPERGVVPFGSRRGIQLANQQQLRRVQSPLHQSAPGPLRPTDNHSPAQHSHVSCNSYGIAPCNSPVLVVRNNRPQQKRNTNNAQQRCNNRHCPPQILKVVVN